MKLFATFCSGKACLVALLALAAGGVRLQAQKIPNPSFETGPAFKLAPGYISGAGNGNITGWVASDDDSVGLNPAAGLYPISGAGNVPQGKRVAFIQSNGGATTLSTTITGLKVGTLYRLQFQAARREGGDVPEASYRVNGGPAIPFNVSPAATGSTPYLMITGLFNATAATAALEIANTIVSGDATLLVDHFSIAAVAAVQVTNAGNDGPGSLRQALVAAAATPVLTVINFAPALSGRTITLYSELAVNDAGGVVIDATGLLAGLTIDGGPNPNRVFSVAGGTSLRLQKLTLTGGASEADGGAIDNHGALTMLQCTLSGNAGADGGGIHNSGALTMLQCTLSGNAATADGGAILNEGSLVMDHCTVAANSAAAGGGIHNQGDLSLTNSIVADNSATDSAGADVRNEAAVTRVGANLVSSFFNAAEATESGPAAIAAEAKLEALADNGGPTRTVGLKGDSPARNGAVGSTITVDQRGRGVQGVADLGASEVQRGTFVIQWEGMEALSVSFPEADTVAHAVISRTDGVEGAASVLVATVPLNATAGEDYEPLSQTITFSDGETSKSVDITLLADEVEEPNETFVLTLSNASSGSSIGTPQAINRTIIDPSLSNVALDLSAPAGVAVSYPVANAVVAVDAGGTVTVKGTAKDDRGLAAVKYRMRTGGALPSTFTDATLARAAGIETEWSALITPVAGLNIIEVQASDDAGKTMTVTRSFRVHRPLAVQIVGNGSVNAGFSPASYREVSSVLTLTAVPAKVAAPGLLFAGWTVSGASLPSIGVTSAAALLQPKLTLVFREGLVLRATFVPNPFIPSVIGTFNGGVTASGALPDRHPFGLLGDEDGTAMEVSTEGYITASVTGTGGFSSKLSIDGQMLAVAGTFDATGVARFGKLGVTTWSIARLDKPTLAVTLQMDVLDQVNGRIIGKVMQVDTGVVAVSDVVANRVAFGALIPVHPALLGPGGANGIFTASIQAREDDDQPAGFAAVDYPQGFGFASTTVTKLSIVTFAGTLADGTTVTASTALANGGFWRLYAPLYNKRGVIAGDMKFSPQSLPDQPFTALDGEGLFWVRPVQDTQHYPLGWQEGILADLLGAPYTVPLSSSVLPVTPAAGGESNARLWFALDLTPEFLDKEVAVNATDTVINTPADASFTLAINRKTGALSGMFNHGDLQKVPYKGLIVQRPGAVGGYGYYLTPVPKAKDYSGQSFGVQLQAIDEAP